jgi:GNAT superfamily N-acetyltransferase
MKVRELNTPAQGLDVEWLAQLHHEEFGGSREFDTKAVERACIHCITDTKRRHLNCWIVYDEAFDKPVGYLAATMHSSFYSFRSYAVQEMWYVLPHFRGTSAAIRLVREFEQWAHERGAERVYMQVEHDDDKQLVERIFSLIGKLGYHKKGYIAVKVLNNVEDMKDARTTHSSVGAEQAQV